MLFGVIIISRVVGHLARRNSNLSSLLRPPAGRQYCMPISQEPLKRSLPNFQQLENSAHTNLVDVQLNNTMRTITGAVRCTRTDWLPVLSNIAPADIRREMATSGMILRARGKPELPLLTDIDFHPRPRLKSRRPIWSNLPDEAPTIQHLWHTRWQVVDVPNKSLINDPTTQLPGMDLPRGQSLNGAC